MSEIKCKICNNDVCLYNNTKSILRLCLIDTEERECSKCGFNRAYKLYFSYGDFTGTYQCWLCKNRS